MQNYLWSPTNNAFFPAEMIDDYRASGWDFNDLILVEDAVFDEYSVAPPAGKIRGISADGLPEWINEPPLEKEQQIAIAERHKLALKAAADSEISWRQDAVDADIATDKEASELAEWKKYRVLLMRVNTSSAPDIKWPQEPQPQ
ncbi:tail fiber assembly protein [Atlantibacter sp.]|uniref:tail fiber assembly protein n=1 Tax=Atlantibacter sp. TaxID=1903473 RepID=UPI0028B152C8|nr:tail fiber assembly protein [Atlantibacter sp.]